MSTRFRRNWYQDHNLFFFLNIVKKIILTERKPSVSEIMKANRQAIIALLSFPIVGMIIVFVLVLYKRPDSVYVALGVISFPLVQYSLMVYLLIRRLDSLEEKGEDKRPEDQGGYMRVLGARR
jgi:preprotein translocase subunit Sss1